MIAVPHPVNMFSGKAKSLIVNDKSSRKDLEEHPCALTLGELMLYWSRVHSVILRMSRLVTRSSSGYKESCSTLILKRNMVPLGPKTVSLGNIEKSEVDMSTAKEGTFAVMDYPVFLSGKSSDPTETYEDVIYSSSGFIRSSGSKYGKAAKHTFGSAMINLGKTKLDTSSKSLLFRPQIGVIVKGHARSFTGEGVSSIGNLGVVDGLPLTAGETNYNGLQIYGQNSYDNPSSSNAYYELDSHLVTGGFEIGGYFSEFKILSTGSTEGGFSINVSFPAKTDYIDYSEYLEEVWAGPNKGKKGSVSSSSGTILFAKPVAPWSGPVMFAKKNRADWFLSDDHVSVS